MKVLVQFIVQHFIRMYVVYIFDISMWCELSSALLPENGTHVWYQYEGVQ